MNALSQVAVTRLKVLVFGLCLVPLADVVAGVMSGRAGADPVEALTHTTGLWALRLLLLTLTLSPLRKLTGWCWLLRLRRIIALYSFFYASLHTLIYLAFEHEFEWRPIVADVIHRPWAIEGSKGD